MGASQSSVVDSEKVFYPESTEGTVNFSPALISQLNESTNSTDPSPARQSSLDSHISSLLAKSLSKVRAQESEIQARLAAELEKENLGKEGSSSANSLLLKEDLEEVTKKVQELKDRFGSAVSVGGDVKEKEDAVKNCLLSNSKTPLNCYKETSDFKEAVSKLEEGFVAKLR